MLVDFLNVDDTLVTTTDCDNGTSFYRSNRGFGKHPLGDISDSHFADSPTKRMRSSPMRISCKARGLSNRHNDDNAYLEIPIDAPHGLPLSCSYPECAGSGRRFRYCRGKQVVTHMQRRERCSPASYSPFCQSQFARSQLQSEISSSVMVTVWLAQPCSSEARSMITASLAKALEQRDQQAAFPLMLH